MQEIVGERRGGECRRVRRTSEVGLGKVRGQKRWERSKGSGLRRMSVEKTTGKAFDTVEESVGATMTPEERVRV